jgi:dihydroorotase
MFCNYAFYFGATPDNASELADLKDLEGCCGIKLFAGSSTGNLLVQHEADIEKVFQSSSKVVAVHSEDEEILNMRKKLIKEGDVHTHPLWRNEECAISSTRRIVRIAECYKKKAHILHITTKQEIDFLSQHKGNITFEITPQHLTIFAPDCYEKLGTYAQMNPPLRNKSHYDRLWYGVRNNFPDTIGSDHAPHLKTNKEKSYPNSPSGMPGVQTLMPVMLNHVNNEKLSLKQLMDFVCENPVKIFGIKNKGFIKEGFDADFTIVDMNKKILIKNKDIESKCGWSPFDGLEFKGTPVLTIVGGQIKMRDGQILGEPEGKPLVF